MSNRLNANISKRIPFKVTISCLLFLILTPIIIPAILTTQVKAASVPSYKYYNSGNDIGAVGGQFGDNTVKLSFTTTGSNTATGPTKIAITYTGSTKVTVTYNDSFWNWVPFLNIGSQTVTCTAGVQINVNPIDRTTGSISTPASLNNPEPTYGAQGQAHIDACSAKTASHISDFNQSNISIGGSTSDTTQIGDQPESINTSQIEVAVYSNVSSDKLPSGMKVTLTPLNLSGTGTKAMSSDLTLLGDPVEGQTFFKNIDPGKYTVCITPSSIFDFDQCQTITKTLGTLFVVTFGTPNTVSFSLGKTVKVTVNIKIPSGVQSGTYGPIIINLKNTDSGTILNTTNTGTQTLDPAHIPASEDFNLTTSPNSNFNSVEPSAKANDYKVCLGDTSLCSTFTKEVNTESNVTITVPADQSSQFFTLLNTTSCSVEGIGWIVCPTLTFLGKISDVAFNFLASSFLSTNTSLLNTDPNNGTIATYNAWQIMRNIANVAFVIAFLIIIFSQITSIGITNYGIKKMFPKLIIAAILVNLSFVVCQIAVDLSNISGYSFKSLFSSLSQLMQTPDVFSPGNATGNGFGIAALITAGLAGGVTLLFAISVPVLLSVFLALLMIVLILIARTALIVLLVIISPLAFVAYLLPNTEQYFKKWGKMFANLLLVFPIISILFGAGSLAGFVIKASAGEDKVMQLVAIGVAIVPLFMVPSLLKNSMSAAGSIGTKLAGLSTKANGRIGSKVKETSMLGAYKTAWDRNQQIKRAQITGGVYRGRNPLTRLASGRNAFLNSSRVTGTMGTRTAQQAAQLANKLDMENVESGRAQLRQANVTNAELNTISNGGNVRGINGRDVSIQAAAMDTQLERGQFAEFQTAWDNMITTYGDRHDRHGDEMMRTIASTVGGSKNRPAFIGAGDIQFVQEGHRVNGTGDLLNLEDIARRGAIANRYSSNRLATTSNEEIRYVLNSLGGAPIPANLRDSAIQALDSPEIAQGIGNNIDHIRYLAGRGPRP